MGNILVDALSVVNSGGFPDIKYIAIGIKLVLTDITLVRVIELNKAFVPEVPTHTVLRSSSHR
jgi:hypothetical protein